MSRGGPTDDPALTRHIPSICLQEGVRLTIAVLRSLPLLALTTFLDFRNDRPFVRAESVVRVPSPSAAWNAGEAFRERQPTKDPSRAPAQPPAPP
jgi:hypothetical protein